MEFNWNDCINDLQNDRCILLLGPDLIQINGKSFTTFLSESLKKTHADQIDSYYEREHLFLFKGPVQKKRVTSDLKNYYREHSPDEALLRKIVSIPCHLILTVTPDTFIADAFIRYHIGRQFRYFDRSEKPQQDFESPLAANPLVYNLVGTKDDFQSLVMDYDDLYDYLKKLLGSPGLPTKLRETFVQASTFIFLGFQLDKWYTQLLLRLLSDQDDVSRFASEYIFPDDNQKEFFKKQFKFGEVGEQNKFLNELVEKCAAKNMLRPLPEVGEAASGIVDVVRRLADADWRDAIGIYTKIVQEQGLDMSTVAQFKANFEMIEKSKSTLSPDKYREEIRIAINKMLSQLGHENQALPS